MATLERTPDGSKDENVFDIMQGVSIGIFVKKPSGKQKSVYKADLWGLRESKYKTLWESDASSTPWQEISPQAPFYLFSRRNENLAAEFEVSTKVTDVFPVNSVGIATARDKLTIAFDESEIWQRVLDFAALSEDAAREKYNLGKDARDWKVSLAQANLNTPIPNENKIRPVLYRPFNVRYTYYTGQSRGFHCMPRGNVMRHLVGGSNLALVTSRLTKGETFHHAQVSRSIVEVICMSPKTSNNGFVFPLYLYSDPSSLYDTGLRRPNLSPKFVEELAGTLGLEFIDDGKGDVTRTFGPEDIFHYIYAVFHAPSYRERYAEFLKSDFPRVPLTGQLELFQILTTYGETLVALHLMERVGSPISSYPVDGDNVVEKPPVFVPGDSGTAGRVYINKTQYFDGVPASAWDFHVGGYRVLYKWLSDRKGRALSYDDLRHYGFIVSALFGTIGTMREIDAAIAECGGWPLT